MDQPRRHVAIVVALTALAMVPVLASRYLPFFARRSRLAAAG